MVADDALSALRDSHRRRVLSFCDRELVGMTLIRLGHDPVLDGFRSRTLHIIERPGGPRLRSNPPPGAGPPVASPTGSSQSWAAGSIVDRSAAKADARRRSSSLRSYHPDFTQELPRKWPPTKAKETQS